MTDLAAYSATLRDHQEWIQYFSSELCRRWKLRLANEPEGAICEAILREELSAHGSNIKPGEQSDTGGLDFVCQQSGKEFYVECTCITRDVVTRKTSLPDVSAGAQSYAHLTREFQSTIREKGRQLGKYPGTCRVLAICTLHFSAGALCFSKAAAEMVLVEPKIAWHIHTKTGEPIGDTFQISDLKNAAFLKPGSFNEPTPIPARQYASAVLLCAFGSTPRSICGILNSDASVRFDRNLLPGIEFCTQLYDPKQTSVVWV